MQKTILAQIIRLIFGGFCLSICLSACQVFFGTYSISAQTSKLKQADTFRKEGRFAEAVSLYESYITDRLKDRRRSEKENPYFFYLYVGDCQLALKQPDKAEQALIKAKDNDVQLDLVASKLRFLGQWYEEQGQLEQALEFLQKYRALDKQLFDYDIDRIHKKLIAEEDSKAASR